MKKKKRELRGEMPEFIQNASNHCFVLPRSLDCIVVAAAACPNVSSHNLPVSQHLQPGVALFSCRDTQLQSIGA